MSNTINTIRITTRCGMVHDFNELDFLSKTELKEFNSVGYSGRTTQGILMNRESYLNSLNKGDFKIQCLREDNGDFSQDFLIIHVPVVEN